MLANSVSLLRIGLVPLLLWSLHRDGSGLSWISAVLLMTAAASDCLDGIAARRLGQVSDLGRILDPLADKLLVGSLGIALVFWRGFPLWLMVLQLARDVAIVTAGVALLRYRGVVASASRAGKGATVAMVFAIGSYIIGLPAPIQRLSVFAAAALLLVSSVGYVRALRRMWDAAGNQGSPEEQSVPSLARFVRARTRARRSANRTRRTGPCS